MSEISGNDRNRRPSVGTIQAMNCVGCVVLNLAEEQESHIIRRHFIIDDRHAVQQRESFFFGNLISPAELFYIVRLTPRTQLEQGEWRGNRFSYYLTFQNHIGIYPVLAMTSNRIKIICGLAQCPACGVNRPTEIVTIFPV